MSAYGGTLQILKDLEDLHWRADRKSALEGSSADLLGPSGSVKSRILRDLLLQSQRKQGFSAGPFYGRARCSLVWGSLKPLRT